MLAKAYKNIPFLYLEATIQITIIQSTMQNPNLQTLPIHPAPDILILNKIPKKLLSL
jgi:hypothetical protein